MSDEASIAFRSYHRLENPLNSLAPKFTICKDEDLANELGTFPCKLLDCNFSTLNDLELPRSSGMDPSSRFLDRSMSMSECDCPNEDGTPPVINAQTFVLNTLSEGLSLIMCVGTAFVHRSHL